MQVPCQDGWQDWDYIDSLSQTHGTLTKDTHFLKGIIVRHFTKQNKTSNSPWKSIWVFYSVIKKQHFCLWNLEASLTSLAGRNSSCFKQKYWEHGKVCTAQWVAGSWDSKNYGTAHVLTWFFCFLWFFLVFYSGLLVVFFPILFCRVKRLKSRLKKDWIPQQTAATEEQSTWFSAATQLSNISTHISH